MNSKKKIKSNEYNISKLEEFSNIIFDANKNNKLWQTINMFLIGFDIGSKDLTKFSKFVIFNDYYKNTLFLKEYGITDGKDNYKTLYNWTLISKNYYKIFITFMKNLKNFYHTMKKDKQVFFGKILTNNKKKGTMIYTPILRNDNPLNLWTFFNHLVYVGEFKDGKRDGKGKMTYLNGNVYDGEFKDDRHHGYGELFSVSMQIRYVGYWKNGFRSGLGTEYYISKTSLNGFWKGGKKYEGGWNGKKHGKGIFTWNDGREFVGNWNYGKKSYTECKMTYSNGDIFVGRLKNYKREGRGKMTYSNGSVYVGEWKNDKRNGKGTYTHVNSDKVYVGEWKDGKRYEKNTITGVDLLKN